MPTPLQKKQHLSKLKSSVSYLLHNPKELLALLFILLIVLGPLTFWAAKTYKHHQQTIAIAKERAHYSVTLANIRRLTKEISTNTPKPLLSSEDNTCGYASRDYGRGPLGCSVGWFSYYEVANIAEASNLQRLISQLIRSDSDFSYRDFINSSINSSKNIELGGEDFGDVLTELICTSSYKYHLPDDAEAPLLVRAKQTFGVEINCGGSTKAEYYPVQ